MNDEEILHNITEKNMEGDPQFETHIERLRMIDQFVELRLAELKQRKRAWEEPGVRVWSIPAEKMDREFITYLPDPTVTPMFESLDIEKPFPSRPLPLNVNIHVAMAIAWCGGSESYCLGVFFTPGLAQEAVKKAKDNQKTNLGGFDLKVFTVQLGKTYKMWEMEENADLRPEIP